MSEVRVEARLADGGMQEWTLDEDFIVRLALLEAQGLKGRALADQLISDDWGAPPITLTIVWRGRDGIRLERRIDCEQPPTKRGRRR